MSFWAYMLHCSGGSFYVGHTDDLDRRIAQHETGAAGAFTATRRAVKLVWSDEFPSRLEALEAERRLKGWSRSKKMALIRKDWKTISFLARSRDPQTVRAEPVEAPSCLSDAEEKNSPSTSSGRTEFTIE